MILLSTVIISLRNFMWTIFIESVASSWACSDSVTNYMMLIVMMLLSIYRIPEINHSKTTWFFFLILNGKDNRGRCSTDIFLIVTINWVQNLLFNTYFCPNFRL